MSFSVSFIVFGEPVGKGRPRFSKVGGFVKTYTEKKTLDYEKIVRTVAEDAMGIHEPLETPVAVYLYIRLPIPASYSKKRTQACIDGLERPSKKPDIDNVGKSVLDAMNGIVYKDDSQIVDLHIAKVYAVTPAVEVVVSEQLP